jgi:hypothetical protein
VEPKYGCVKLVVKPVLVVAHRDTSIFFTEACDTCRAVQCSAYRSNAVTIVSANGASAGHHCEALIGRHGVPPLVWPSSLVRLDRFV